MKERIVRISFDASVDGMDLEVEGASISLGVNSIPSIELDVTPAYAQESTPLKPGVYTPVVSDFSDLYNRLSEKAQGLSATGNVDITVETDGYRPGTDSLSLGGWILSGVGMSNVSATAAPHLVVILQHPICRLTKVGSIYETPKSLVNKAIYNVCEDKESFLDIVKAVYGLVRTSDAAFNPAPSNMPAIFRHSLGAGEFDPGNYLEESAPGLFLGRVLKDGRDRIAAAIGNMVFPVNGGSSTWDMIVGAAGTLMLNVVQDQSHNFTTDRLLLEPIMPWKSQSLVLDEEMCNWTDLPGVDMFKLVGVMARAFAPFNESVTLGQWRGGNPAKDDIENQVNDVLYVPEGMDPSTSDGRIMKTSAPVVLDQALRMDSAMGEAIATSNMQFVQERAVGFNRAIYKYCQAVYETSAGSMAMGKAQMALGFRDANGNLILPGNTCKFVSKGRDIYFGYVRQVVHSMSTRGSCCTTVNMSHVRSEEEYKVYGVPVIGDGNSNAAY